MCIVIHSSKSYPLDNTIEKCNRAKNKNGIITKLVEKNSWLIILESAKFVIVAKIRFLPTEEFGPINLCRK